MALVAGHEATTAHSCPQLQWHCSGDANLSQHRQLRVTYVTNRSLIRDQFAKLLTVLIAVGIIGGGILRERDQILQGGEMLAQIVITTKPPDDLIE